MSKTLAEHAECFKYKAGVGPMPETRAPFGRHTRKCMVCHHPECEGIELEFLHWRSPRDIAEDYGLEDYSSIYRRAHASGLFERRRATIRFALEPIIEQAANVRVTPESVVRADRAYACINKTGEWINPPVQIIHHVGQPSVAEPAASPDPPSDGQSNLIATSRN
jgi:hypothetical protein